MIHWGLLFSTTVLAIALLVGVAGVWGASGTVMWVTRIAFLVLLFGSFWSILVRRRDSTPAEG